MSMNTKPPIPPRLWGRIQKFLDDASTGEVVLHVHRGHVQSISVNERMRDVDPASLEKPSPPTIDFPDPNPQLLKR